MKRIMCACTLILTVLAGGGTPAQATPGACVSRGEFHQVHRGMTRHQVRHIFGAKGRRTAFSRHGQFTSEVRRYRGCARHTAVSVAYINDRARSKSASWD